MANFGAVACSTGRELGIEMPEDKSETGRRRHREMLGVSVAVLVLTFLLQMRSDGRVAARGLADYPLPPLCGSQLFFNMKCPGCGLTRSFVYWAGGDFATAQRAHRIGGLMFMTVLMQIPYRLV